MQLLRILKEEDSKIVAGLTKPLFTVVTQGLLNILKRKGLLHDQKNAVAFLTEENIGFYEGFGDFWVGAKG